MVRGGGGGVWAGRGGQGVMVRLGVWSVGRGDRGARRARPADP